MNGDLVQILRCPHGGGELRLADGAESEEVSEGILEGDGGVSYPIAGGVPRFVSEERYTSSFGRQWNRWATTQYDSVNGSSIFRDRFRRYFGDPSRLAGKTVLDAGCGAGAFTDVVAPHASRVVGMDLSSAVEAAAASHGHLAHVDIVQADLTRPPLAPESFDFVFCFGVLQHLPDPQAGFDALVPLVKPGGTIAVWVYERTPYEVLKPRHWVRLATTRLDEDAAIPAMRRYYEVARPARRRLARLPGGRVLSKLVPVADLTVYRGDPESELSGEQIREWEVMDTHDMLVTTYDNPQSPNEVARWFRGHGLEPFRSSEAEAVAMFATKPSPAR